MTEKASEKKSQKSKASKGHEGEQEAYLVLARKYRPADFSDLIGQDAMVQTLRNAFASGRIAQSYMLIWRARCGQNHHRPHSRPRFEL